MVKPDPVTIDRPPSREVLEEVRRILQPTRRMSAIERGEATAFDLARWERAEAKRQRRVAKVAR